MPTTMTTGYSAPPRFMPLWLRLCWVTVGVQCLLIIIVIEHRPMYPFWAIASIPFLVVFPAVVGLGVLHGRRHG